MLEVNLFGAGEARYCTQPIPGFPNRQPCLLLCYMLLNRQYIHPRERIAAVFWDKYPTPTSMKYLRNCIWRMRNELKAVGAPADEYLSTCDDSISFRRSSHYWLDVEAFETKVALCQDLQGQQMAPEQAAYLEEAVELYVGDSLEGIYEDWCLCDRERLKMLYLNALGKLMVFHEAHGTYEQGLACGERILACDNIREGVHREMMRLYWLLGNRVAALTQYKRCAQILRETLGIEPMEETTRLYRQIVHNEFHPPNWPDCGGVPLPRASYDGPTQVPTKYILQRVIALHATVEEASAELGRIENLVRETILNSAPTTSSSSRPPRS